MNNNQNVIKFSGDMSKAYERLLINKLLPTAGWIYALSNPSMPYLLKIGYTQVSPIVRAEQLSKWTGVPVDFEVEFYTPIFHVVDMERFVHKELAEHRINEHREFFNCDRSEAIEAIQRATEKVEDYYSRTLEIFNAYEAAKVASGMDWEEYDREYYEIYTADGDLA